MSSELRCPALVAVPEAFREVKDPGLLAEFKASNNAAVEALKKYQKFLQEDLLPASHGDFRLGSGTFSQKLLYDEMVDIPLDRLLEVGYADLRRNQQRLKEVAAEIDSHRTPAEVLADLRKEHPPAERLLQSFRDTLGGLRQFIEQKKIITLPSTVPPIVEETPPFQRSTTSASMDTPGPFETAKLGGFYNMTLPDPRTSAELGLNTATRNSSTLSAGVGITVLPATTCCVISRPSMVTVF